MADNPDPEVRPPSQDAPAGAIINKIVLYLFEFKKKLSRIFL